MLLTKPMPTPMSSSVLISLNEGNSLLDITNHRSLSIVIQYYKA